MKALPGSTYVFQHVLRCQYGEWPPTPSASYGDLDTDDEQSLLVWLRQGTRQQRKNAFTVLYKRYYLDVWKYVRSRTTTEDDARDIFCEVWHRAFKQLPNYEWREKSGEGQPQSIKPWLLTTATNITREYRRKFQDHIDIWDLIESELEVKILAPSESSLPSSEEADALVQSLLPRLSEQEHSVIILKYFNNWKNVEIAKALGITSGHVGVIIFRALEKMRRA